MGVMSLEKVDWVETSCPRMWGGEQSSLIPVASILLLPSYRGSIREVRGVLDIEGHRIVFAFF